MTYVNLQALVGSFPSSKMEECLSIMAETRCHEFATQLHTSPSLFGEVVVHSGHLEAMLLRGPHPPLSLVSGTLKVLQAIKLQLPGVGAPDEEAQLLLHWLLKLVEGEPKERLLKGLTHVVSSTNFCLEIEKDIILYYSVFKYN